MLADALRSGTIANDGPTFIEGSRKRERWMRRQIFKLSREFFSFWVGKNDDGHRVAILGNYD
jgi:hypothetical protein